mgnify:CR=1 FL=1
MHVGKPTAAFAGVLQKFYTVDDQRIKNAPKNGSIGGEKFLRRRVAQLIRDPGFGRLQKYSSHLEHEVRIGNRADIEGGAFKRLGEEGFLPVHVR